MKPPKWFAAALLVGVFALPAAASARVFSVAVRTDRGNDAVYRPGEKLEIEARASEDAYLLIYEIDAEGHVHLLYPGRGSRGFVESDRRIRLPEEDSDLELVAQGPVGQGYIVALASLEPFADLPWYLRPYDATAEEIGYYGEEDEEQGVTAEGRIVGDPFVAMERIRRRVLENPDDDESFATAYTSYYVHHEVRYPRYLCYDCHRPGRWQWWEGFDPYYTSCSVFEFRVNRSWWWGPRYWFGFVPYYVYAYRPDCPPHYRRGHGAGAWFSSWDGWRRWRSEWGDRLTRFKTPPPPGYTPPSKYADRGRMRDPRSLPPGFARRFEERGRLREDPRARRVNDRLGDPGRERRRWTGDDGRTRRGTGYARPGEGDEPWRRTSDGERRRDPRPGIEPRPEPGVERPGRIPRTDPRPAPDPGPEVRRPREPRPVPSGEPREDRRDYSRPREPRQIERPSAPPDVRPSFEPRPAPRIERGTSRSWRSESRARDFDRRVMMAPDRSSRSWNGERGRSREALRPAPRYDAPRASVREGRADRREYRFERGREDLRSDRASRGERRHGR
jgi:hypothetical protein